MNRFYRLLFLLLPAFMIAGCSDDDNSSTTPEILDFFSFQTNTAYVEEGSSVDVTIFWSKTTPQSGTVEVEAYEWGSKYKAVEGVDYTISDTEFFFDTDDYYHTITITTIPNDYWQNDRTFRISLTDTDTDSKLGGSGRESHKVDITILDDDDSMFEVNYTFNADNGAGAITPVSAIPTPRDGRRGDFTFDFDFAKFDFTVRENYEDEKTGDNDDYLLYAYLPQLGGTTNDDKLLYWVAYYEEDGQMVHTLNQRTLEAYSAFENVKFTFLDKIGLALAVYTEVTDPDTEETELVFEDYYTTVGGEEYTLLPGTLTLTK